MARRIPHISRSAARPAARPISAEASFRRVPATPRGLSLPDVEGPVLLIASAVGKGLWYLGSSLARQLRRQGLEVTRASLKNPMPERCEGWDADPAVYLPDAASYVALAAEHRTVISLEGKWRSFLPEAKGVRRIDVPNYDCVFKAGIRSPFYRGLDEIWAMTDVMEQVFRSRGIQHVRKVFWDVADEEIFHPPELAGVEVRNPEPTFYFPRADGGVADRKGTKLVLAAFAEARKQAPMRLILSTTKPLNGFEVPDGVDVQLGRWPRRQLADWYRQADWVLYPSQREGLGMTFFEAGKCGTPVITTDAPPMNEPAPVEKILVPVSRTREDPKSIAPINFIDPKQLAAVLVQMAGDRESTGSEGEASTPKKKPRKKKPTNEAEQKTAHSSGGQRSMVLITSHKRPKLLRRTLESVLATTPDDCPILVIDDGSSSTELRWLRSKVEQIERLELQVKPKRSGLADSLNRGIAHAAANLGDADLLYYLQDDTEVEAGWLEALAHLWNTYRRELHLGFVSGHLAPEHWQQTWEDDGRPRLRFRGVEPTAHGDVVLSSSIRATNMVADIATWRSHGKIPNRRAEPTPTRRGKGRGLGSNVDWFLLRDGAQATVKRGQKCGVLPGYVKHIGDAARDSTWNNSSPEYSPQFLARFRRYDPENRRSEPGFSLKHFKRLVHFRDDHGQDGDFGEAAKFGHYLQRTTGCELATGTEDLEDPETLYIVDHHRGLELGERASCVTILHSCAAQGGFDPEIGALQRKMAKRPRQYTIANSDETAVECRNCYGSQVDEIIHPAVDESLYWPTDSPTDSPTDRPRVLLAAKARHKGSEMISKLRAVLKDRFELELLDGPVDDEPKAFRRAQIFLNLSTHEGFCYALLEALAADCAVLTTRHGLGYDLPQGLVTTISDPDARDVDRLAGWIEKVWQEHRPGVGRQWVIDHCSLARFEQLIQAALKRADRHFGATATTREEPSEKTAENEKTGSQARAEPKAKPPAKPKPATAAKPKPATAAKPKAEPAPKPKPASAPKTKPPAKTKPTAKPKAPPAAKPKAEPPAETANKGAASKPSKSSSSETSPEMASSPEPKGPSYRNWTDPRLPARQGRQADHELMLHRRGRSIPAFRIATQAVRRIRKGCKTLLDVGCASGHYWEVLRPTGLRYRGCDLSPTMISLARKRHRQATFEVRNALDLDYADAAFDIVFSSAVLSHCREYERAFRELARVSRKFLVLHRFYLPDKGMGDREVVESEQNVYDTVTVPLIFIARSRLLRLAKESGLELVRELPLSPGQATFIFAKTAV